MEVLLHLAQINAYFADWHACCIEDPSVGRLIVQMAAAICHDYFTQWFSLKTLSMVISLYYFAFQNHHQIQNQSSLWDQTISVHFFSVLFCCLSLIFDVHHQMWFHPNALQAFPPMLLFLASLQVVSKLDSCISFHHNCLVIFQLDQ